MENKAKNLFDEFSDNKKSDNSSEPDEPRRKKKNSFIIYGILFLIFVYDMTYQNGRILNSILELVGQVIERILDAIAKGLTRS